MKSIEGINQRLTRIEKLLEKLVLTSQPTTGDITNEIAMVKAQGKDLATYFKEKGRAQIRLDRQSRKRS